MRRGAMARATATAVVAAVAAAAGVAAEVTVVEAVAAGEAVVAAGEVVASRSDGMHCREITGVSQLFIVAQYLIGLQAEIKQNR